MVYRFWSHCLSTIAAGRRHASSAAAGRALRMMVSLLLIPAGSLAVLTVAASPAGAVGSVSSSVDSVNGFPSYYQDSAGNRVEQCLDPGDPNCVVVASDFFNPAAPTVFPSNFPDEFFYALADSDIVSTPGCAGTLPGKASVRLALEGAFVNGGPVAGEQMVFGRIRVKVSSGLCPGTTYQFKHPFGTETFTTNAAGGVPPNVGTEDIGCVPTPPGRCDFSLAKNSRVFGSAATGFLRWDGADRPLGYLGDPAVPHTVTGGTNGNAFEILDSVGGSTGLSTSQFTVAGKLAGSLTASPSPADFGGVQVGVGASAPLHVTVTNVDTAAVTIGATRVVGADAAVFSAAAAAHGPIPACTVGLSLGRDASCNVDATFTPTVNGRIGATLQVDSTGGVRSPVNVSLTGSGVGATDAPVASVTPTALAFGDVRVRTASPARTVTVTNTGTSPLKVDSVALDVVNHAADSSQYLVTGDTCSGLFVDPAHSCQVDVLFAPSVTGAHATSLLIDASDSGTAHTVALTGNGTGGVAAVSSKITDDGFADWYRDENGVKVEQCIDPADPNCIVFADDTFDPALPLHFPDNFPGEFFYQVATSDNVETPGCNGSSPGRAFVRTALEGAFSGLGPEPNEQIVFGRIRIVVTGGLCPSTTYHFTHPYGTETFTTNAAGAVARNAGTEDVGCFPVAPDTCDFSLALSSRVMGGLVRWDPAVAPAAPAGYLGDAASLHAIVGAPYKPDGVNPANYFRITDTNDDVVGETSQFTVMGKLRGPLESQDAAGEQQPSLTLDPTTVGGTSPSRTVRLVNTGIAPLTISSVGTQGTDASEFTPSTNCVGSLAVNATCVMTVSFSPAVVGNRNADLVVHHDGLNDPLIVHLSGIGDANEGNAAVSFEPRSATFATVHVGDVSPAQTITVSNAGGQHELNVTSVSLTGLGAAQFTVTDNRCEEIVPIGGSCQVDVAFSPQVAGSFSANLVTTDNAPGGTHSMTLAGVGSAATSAVSASVDSANGYPNWYQDRTGTRLGTCLDPADPNCIVLGDAGFNPALPVAFPGNFPSEFFYSLADSDAIPTPGCGGTAPGTAQLRVALEGSFANGAPAAGDQTTFGRLRISVTQGLCPNTPYVFVTPYGPVNFTTNGVGGLARNQGTEDIGCGPVAPATCDFSEALGGRIAASFPRWNPAQLPAAPAGYLGDARSLHTIVGGTARDGNGRPINYAAISELAGNVVAQTDRFTVSGRVAGPLVADQAKVDFGRGPAQATSTTKQVVVTNVATSPTQISAVAISGVDASQFQLAAGGTCLGAPVATDATCLVRVTFAPTTAGTKNAVLRVTPASGAPLVVALVGIADPPTAPAITVTPGVLAYGTVTAPASRALATTVKNTGTANLVVGAPTVSGSNAVDYTVTGNTCTTPVAPNATCLVTVTFKPSVTGARTASLTIPHNATGGSTQVSLTGTGAGSTFSMSPSPVKFGTINRGQSTTTTVSVKNSGTIAFTPGAVTFAGAPAGVFSVTANQCSGVSLAAGRTCNITVRFAPTAATTYNGSLTLAGDATSLPASVSVSLTGTGK